jgi:hypothetical protein
MVINFFFFLVAPTLGSLLPLLEHRAELSQFLDQGQSVGLLGRVISSSQGLLPVHKHRKTHTHTQTLNIHALSGIRPHGPGFRASERASEDSARLTPVGYRDRLINSYFRKINIICTSINPLLPSLKFCDSLNNNGILYVGS